MAYDPTRIKKIEFEGKYYKLSASHETHPSPQRVPVLFQAGLSKAGVSLAGANAEGLFCGSMVPSSTAAYVKSIRAAAAAAGRDPKSVKAFAGLSTFIAPTLEEAQAMYDAAAKNVTPESGLALFSSYTNIDMSKYAMDEPFNFEGDPTQVSIHGYIKNFQAGDGQTKVWTPRMLGSKMALGSLFPTAIGTPSMVADFIQKWVEETDVDGFNLYCESKATLSLSRLYLVLTYSHPDCELPETFENVVNLLIPELQRRGVYWLDYPVPGGTFRENLTVKPGHSRLPDDHPAAVYRREREQARELRDSQVAS